MADPRRRAPRTCAIALALALLPACSGRHPSAYTAPVPDRLRRESQAVAVVALADTPLEPTLQGRAGKGRGAARGGATGAGIGALEGLRISAAFGPLAPLAWPILVPAGAVLGGGVGAAVGAVNTASARQAVLTREALARAQRDLGTELARRVAGRLPTLDRAPAPAGTPGALQLELSVTRWGLDITDDSQATFFLAASARLTGPPPLEGTPVHGFTVRGPRRPLPAWSAEGGAALIQRLELALDEAADQIVDTTFLIQDFHVPAGPAPSTCGLAPVDPPPVFAPSLLLANRVPRVASLRPTLRWEAFPRPQDLAGDQGRLLDRVTDIRYDLRLWTLGPGGEAQALVYARDGLALQPGPPRPDPPPDPDSEPLPPDPSFRVVAHTLETDLAPGTTYLWSFRARFRLDGALRATRWACHRSAYGNGLPRSLTASIACLEDGIPYRHHHRFRTP